MPRSTSLKEIYNHCFAAIGGESNADVYHYLYKRPDLICKQSFFEMAVSAIWVSGMSRNSKNKFLERAEEAGFPNEFNSAGSWDERQRFDLMVELHGYPIPRRAEQKWMAAFRIANMLKNFPSEDSFRTRIFGGKTRSADLDKTDIRRLQHLRLPFIGPANAHYIVRLMGGEAIKCDRWIEGFLDWYPMTLNMLESELHDLDIPLGKFDLVIWCYCEMFVRRVEHLKDHFDREFGRD